MLTVPQIRALLKAITVLADVVEEFAPLAEAVGDGELGVECVSLAEEARRTVAMTERRLCAITNAN